MKTAISVGQILARLKVVSGPDRRGEYICWCPFHNDGNGTPPHTPNLHVSVRGYICFACGAKGGLRELAKKLGFQVDSSDRRPHHGRIEEWYDYCDENGKLLYQVGRKFPKGFVQRCPDGKGGWAWSLNGTRRVVYHLPELISRLNEMVWVVEGEKDADRLAKEGLLATTNPGGAGKWKREYVEFFRGRDTCIIADNDEPGERHAQDIASSLAGVAASVKIVRLPNLPQKGDASDWFAAGGSTTELTRLAHETPIWSQPQNSAKSEAAAYSIHVTEAADDPHRLARLFIDKHYRDSQRRLTLRFWRDQWWWWNGQRYRIIDRQEVRAQLTLSIKTEYDRLASESAADESPRKVTSHLVTNVLQALTGEALLASDTEYSTWIGREQRQRRYLALSNGLLDLDALVAGQTAETIPLTPEWFSPVYLPYGYDMIAQCPRWLEFVKEVLEKDEERITLLQQWFGYCLTQDTSQQRFLVLEGEGANGKSVVCDVLTSLLGQDNVSHVPLEMFGSRFQLTTTLGKLANIAPEVGELDKAAEGFLKAFTSGDRMYFDRKGLIGVDAYPTARLVLATNNRPRFTDRSSGLWRRMILLPFHVTIPENRQNPHLAEELRAELPGIFCWAVIGLFRLRQSGRFTIPTVCGDALEEYRVESNPARGFLLECCSMEIAARTPCATVYSRYAAWCKANGYHPLGEKMLGKEVVRVYPDVRRRRPGSDGNRQYTYEGLAMRSSE